MTKTKVIKILVAIRILLWILDYAGFFRRLGRNRDFPCVGRWQHHFLRTFESSGRLYVLVILRTGEQTDKQR